MFKLSATSIAIILATVPNYASPNALQSEKVYGQEWSQVKTLLTIEEAVRLALASDDPYLNEPKEMASSFEASGIAEAQLQDPKVSMNIANLPLDSFSYTQEPMTQLQLGVSQSFPKGDTLKLRRGKRQAQAQSERYRQELRVREVILDTRLIWLDLNYLAGARSKVLQSRQAISELIEVIQAIFATGRQTSQDILRAELELSLLDDRLVEIDRKASILKAKLARRIGDRAFTSRMPISLPGLKFPNAVDLVLNMLETHPAIKMETAKLDASDKDVGLAGELYKPGWAVKAGFGARGGDRPDFASVGVTMDVPLFTAKRQDKRLQAAQKSRQASRLSRDIVLLDLRKNFLATRADWEQLEKRVSLYESVVLERAKDTSEATLSSYQSGVSDFPELVRARLAELDTELKLLRLKSDRMMAQAQLLFIEGENNA